MDLSSILEYLVLAWDWITALFSAFEGLSGLWDLFAGLLG